MKSQSAGITLTYVSKGMDSMEGFQPSKSQYEMKDFFKELRAPVRCLIPILERLLSKNFN